MRHLSDSGCRQGGGLYMLWPMKSKNRLCFLLSVLVLVGNYARAEDIRIVGSGGVSKINITLEQMKGTRQKEGLLFYSVLKADLKRSGWFSLQNKQKSQISVRGKLSVAGGNVVAACEVINLASGRRYLSQSYQSPASNTRELAHKVADAIVYAVKGVPGMASSRLAMIASQKGKKDIVICDADGHGVIQLTRDGAHCLSPAWAPSGKVLYYTSFFRGFPDVYRIDLASGKRKRVASYPGINAGADISPNGKLMALTLSKDGNPELYVRNLRSGKLTRLTKTINAAEASPSWSPDGRQIAFVSDSTGAPQVYIISASGGRPRRITFRGSENVSPDWGPDGRIAYSSKRGGRYQICVVDPVKRLEKQITSEYVDHEQPCWAPDRRHIACTRTEGYISSVYILDTLGDAPVRLTQFKGDWYSPAWSPR